QNADTGHTDGARAHGNGSMPRSRATASSASRSGPLDMALLAGQPDALHGRQSLGAPHGADGDIHLPLELLGRGERLDRKRHHGMAGIGGLAGLLDKIDDLAAKRGRIENAGKEPDD